MSGLPQVVQFGPFVLDLEKRSLREGEVEVRLGARALDLLIALVERPGDLVSHQDLLLRAWNSVNVDESGLRVHMSALRKALGDGQSGARYIVNEHGRGYRFVGRAARKTAAGDPVPAPQPSIANSLPAQIVRMLGREDAMQSLSAAMQRSRLVTIAGPGGIGKSTLAIAWAERHADRFRDGVRFIDLLSIDNLEMAARWIASALGVGSSSATTPQQVASALRASEMLIVLDNCEHVVDFATDLAEALLSNAPEVHLVATSRETLRASGETLYRLAGLSCPVDTPRTVSEATLYPAVELFLERATASAPALQLSDGDIGTVSDLCRRLDGIPLAIELAAGWIDVVGIRDLASQLDAGLLSQVDGRRTASPRHRSLAAVLEWSYAALDDEARLTLKRLAVFSGSFTLGSAIAVAAGESLRDDHVLRCIATLARKSLLQVDISGDAVLYRLLETTRAYALEQLMASGDERATRLRHARYCAEVVEGAEEDLLTLSWSDWLATYGRLISDTRAALAWAFSGNGDAEIGVQLTLRSLPFGQQFPLSGEYLRFIDAALAKLSVDGADNEPDALRLGYARGMLLSNMSGDPEPFAAVARRWQALEAGEGDAIPEGIVARFGAAITSGNYPETLDAALQMAKVADRSEAAELRLASVRMRAQAEHFLGRHDLAEDLAHEVLASSYEFLPMTQISHKVSMRIVLARIAFLKADPDRARKLVEEAVAHAGANPSAICQTLGMAGVPLGLWIGDHAYAEAAMERMHEITTRAGLDFWGDWLNGFDVALGFKRDGIVRPLSNPAHLAKVVDLLPTFDPALLLPEASLRVARGIVGWNRPEVLRAEALAQRSMEQSLASARQAVQEAERQGAIAWRQRAESTLANLRASQP